MPGWGRSAAPWRTWASTTTSSKQVRDKVTEGTSALFALTSGATAVDKVVDELKQYDFEIISTNLPEEQEKQLREAFAQE